MGQRVLVVMLYLLTVVSSSALSQETPTIRGELTEIVPEVLFDYLYGEMVEGDFCQIAHAIDNRAQDEEKTVEPWLAELHETMREAQCPPNT